MEFFKYLFIFCLFSVVGWILEFSYKGITTKKIVNPGFMSGIVVPLYGFGAVILTIICNIFNKINSNYKILIILFIAIILLTLLEFITGIILLKLFNLKLWDYSMLKYNYKGLISLRFSIFWGILSLLYYYLIYPSIDIISSNLVNSDLFKFGLGIFVGIFLIDLCVSIQLLGRLTKYSKIISQIVDVEKLKIESRKKSIKNKPFNTIYPYISTNRFLRDELLKVKDDVYEKKEKEY